MTREDPSLPNLTRAEVCKRYYENNKKIINQKAADKRACFFINNEEEIMILRNAKKAEVEKQRAERKEIIKIIKEKEMVERKAATELRRAENRRSNNIWYVWF